MSAVSGWDLEKNILCSDGLELLENGLCSNRSLIQPILPSTSNVPMILVNTSPLTVFLIMCGVVVAIIIGVCVLNTERRKYLKSCCCSWYYRKADVRMQYSRINTVEETNALLDAPDTHCQSDSDDDLLTI
ncbi:hypothetical protein PV325_013914 [Microctonus aethiopoides]|uniref:Uncharacterized protein n=1 Tax=Microctonus aethiopoides TaxID=144406 RepID=A0AA39F6F6_9HYME|nr:hypothetical protein PV325_013914 [Microctonus aethiopoides]KAK0093602.1 hypothetical protein PV326_013139 [Microctonus aethiopoides]KAK0163817.1 hypothetical protein PV328_002509 [Microctonus aethiopoides]